MGEITDHFKTLISTMEEGQKENVKEPIIDKVAYRTRAAMLPEMQDALKEVFASRMLRLILDKEIHELRRLNELWKEIEPITRKVSQ